MKPPRGATRADVDVIRTAADVAGSNLTTALRQDDWSAFVYHLGAAMGLLAQVAYGDLDALDVNRREIRERFLAGFDSGVETAGGIRGMLDPAHPIED